MPPPGNPQPDQARDRLVHRVAERTIDERARRSGPGTCRPAAEPHRVRAAVEGSARRRDRRRRVPAGRDRGRRLRQHRGRAQRLAGVPRAVRCRRAQRGASRGRRAEAEARERVLPAAAAAIRTSTSTACRSARAAACSFTHSFPADGEYRFTITDLDVGLYPRALETRADARRAARPQRGVPRRSSAARRPRARRPRRRAGARRDHAAVREHSACKSRPACTRSSSRSSSARAPSTDEPISGFTPYGGFSFTTADARAASDRRHRDRWARSTPTGVSRTREPREDLRLRARDRATGEHGRAPSEITANLARRAFRRPVTKAISTALMPFYEAGAGPGGFDYRRRAAGDGRAREPRFSLSRDRAAASDRGRARSRSTTSSSRRGSRSSSGAKAPTTSCSSSRRAASCTTTDVLAEQVQRMLADPRARALVTNFALQAGSTSTSSTRSIPTSPVPRIHRRAARRLRARRSQLFLTSVLLEEHNVQELLTADYTFVNERLARHYGIASVAARSSAA